MPVVVECPATRVAAGRIVQRAPAELVVPSSDAGREFARLFHGTAVRVTLVHDLRTAAWRELCLNIAGGAITALADRPLGVVRDPAIAEFARGLVAECVAVGRAEGALLEDGLVDEIVARLAASPMDAGTSMLADRRAGRRLEVDARNGAVARIGARHGIGTPLNRDDDDAVVLGRPALLARDRPDDDLERPDGDDPERQEESSQQDPVRGPRRPGWRGSRRPLYRPRTGRPAGAVGQFGGPRTAFEHPGTHLDPPAATEPGTSGPTPGCPRGPEHQESRDDDEQAGASPHTADFPHWARAAFPSAVAPRRTQRMGALCDPFVAVSLRILRVPEPAHPARRGARGEARREGP